MFHWETQKERLERFAKISPKKKLEWLWALQCFTWKVSSRRMRALRRRLREHRI